ncbi:DMT family transporter [Pseudobacteriovorax antillogorgiicola]|uniref:Threonine/homoserine efflux transporter RhtA n=1 Tax=Pseudobacteriovorax antillogorgiicola TaxID=1513793 RepID=A0A1Y6BI04_9BACT|nr:DMT family transporter [Pseudobacteriovorax antillogorgiicola]TCS55528.1 threonine/homoserine efflux transporter RhtA [Pseudobacteriovorax antillogorgiicola]SMF11312.1 Threonine/homoserine efflux transporter RhtA [Pseudobacteriovorax antillogorgiicola]
MNSVKVYLILGLGVLTASQSANIIRIGDASPMAMTAWRLTLATIVLGVFGRVSLRKIFSQRSSLAWGIGAGIALALHFFTWIYAVQKTTVANATLLFGLNPIFVALLELIVFKRVMGRYFFFAVGASLLGLLAILKGEVSSFAIGSHDLVGLMSGLTSTLMFAIYFILGKVARSSFNTWEYTSVCYGTAALLSFLILAIVGLPLIEYSSSNWLCFVLLACFPTILGHTSFNYALNYVPASWVSAATLSEPVFAVIGAYFMWQENISWYHGLCFLFVLASFALLRLELRNTTKV